MAYLTFRFCCICRPAWYQGTRSRSCHFIYCLHRYWSDAVARPSILHHYTFLRRCNASRKFFPTDCPSELVHCNYTLHFFRFCAFSVCVHWKACNVIPRRDNLVPPVHFVFRFASVCVISSRSGMSRSARPSSLSSYHQLWLSILCTLVVQAEGGCMYDNGYRLPISLRI